MKIDLPRSAELSEQNFRARFSLKSAPFNHRANINTVSERWSMHYKSKVLLDEYFSKGKLDYKTFGSRMLSSQTDFLMSGTKPSLFQICVVSIDNVVYQIQELDEQTTYKVMRELYEKFSEGLLKSTDANYKLLSFTLLRKIDSAFGGVIYAKIVSKGDVTSKRMLDLKKFLKFAESL